MQRRPRRVLSAEAECTKLQDGLRRTHDGFYDMGVKVNAALAVALGWFAVQENPLPQLCSKSSANLLWAAVVVLTFCWGAVSFVFYQRYRSSQATAAALAALGVRAPIFMSDLISKPVLATGIAFQLTIFTCLGLSIGLVYPQGSASFPCLLAEAEKEARMAKALAGLPRDISNRLQSPSASTRALGALGTAEGIEQER